MLGNYPIDVVLLAMDLAAAKDFYADTIGLRVLSETEGGVTFQCGGDTHLVVTKSDVGTRDEISELRRRGVQIESPSTIFSGLLFTIIGLLGTVSAAIAYGWVGTILTQQPKVREAEASSPPQAALR